MYTYLCIWVFSNLYSKWCCYYVYHLKWLFSVWRSHWSWTGLHKLILLLAVDVPLLLKEGLAKLPHTACDMLKISPTTELYLIIWWIRGWRWLSISPFHCGCSGAATTRRVFQCPSELIFPVLLCLYWNGAAFSPGVLLGDVSKESHCQYGWDFLYALELRSFSWWQCNGWGDGADSPYSRFWCGGQRQRMVLSQ